MPFARRQSSSDIYHITTRGSGRQIVFEDDDDRRELLRILDEGLEANDVGLLAWCLMDNHFHLVAEGDADDIPKLMHRVNSTYARAFNHRHDRVGPLFQGRYLRLPVEDDGYLLTLVPYVHRNPERAGLSPTSAYPWSSYHEVMEGCGRVDVERLLDLFGGWDGFEEAHADQGPPPAPGTVRQRDVQPEALLEMARSLLGGTDPKEVKAMARGERDFALATLRKGGMIVRSIERLTGVSRGVVSRAPLG